ncbi:MAG: hypothetical protein GC159_09265 [Phycisphaera sp.]|nr:hypothetical protein [Phycisphaera sp.]
MAESEYAACPSCSERKATKVSFTWWGGVIGPSLFTHVKCGGCGTCYNGKTGKSNATAIVVYTIVVLAVFGTLGWYVSTI